METKEALDIVANVLHAYHYTPEGFELEPEDLEGRELCLEEITSIVIEKATAEIVNHIVQELPDDLKKYFEEEFKRDR